MSKVKTAARVADDPDMTWLRLLIASAILATASLGCGILGEIDNAHEEMGIGEKETKKEAKLAKQSKKGKKSRTVAQAKKWWKQVQSLSPTEVDGSITSCTVGGQVKYMTEDDCRSRGGELASR